MGETAPVQGGWETFEAVVNATCALILLAIWGQIAYFPRANERVYVRSDTYCTYISEFVK